MPIMQIENRTSVNSPKSGYIDQKQNNAMPLIINGCSVSFAASAEVASDTVKSLKEILIAVYRTKTTNC